MIHIIKGYDAAIVIYANPLLVLNPGASAFPPTWFRELPRTDCFSRDPCIAWTGSRASMPGM